jgi:phage terminase Nu1 subunit (DNA packaging protein)
MKNEKKNDIQDIEFATLQLAELFGITSRRVRQLAEAGIFNPKPGGKHNLKSSVQSFLKYQIDKERNSDDVLKDAERRKAVAEAELKEIQLETTKGNLIEIEKVVEDWQKIVGVFRTRILLVSSKVAPLLIGLRSLKRIRSIVDAELNESLNELSRINKLK